MTTAYVDAFSGVSGDMLLGALVDDGLSLEELQAALDTLGVQGLRLSSTAERRSGIGATRVIVDYPRQHEHRHLKHIVSLIEAGSLPEEVKGRAVDVFLRLAEAEAEIHRIDPQRVHFHEVGAADAIADVGGTVFGFHHLGIDEILVGPVNVGAGLEEPRVAELIEGAAPREYSAHLIPEGGIHMVPTLVDHGVMLAGDEARREGTVHTLPPEETARRILDLLEQRGLLV